MKLIAFLVLLFQFFFLVEAAYRRGNFSLSSLSNSVVLYSNKLINDYNVSFYWNVTSASLTSNQTQQTQTLFGAFVLTRNPAVVGPLFRSWVGIGFGDGMLNAQFILCHNNNPAQDGINSSVTINEHFSSGTYSPPPHTEEAGRKEIVDPITGLGSSSFQMCLFSRALAPTNGWHKTLLPSQDFNMIWAFNPSSGVNYLNQFFTQHGVNQCGALTINLASGFTTQASVQSFSTKVAHGYGMIFFWLVLLPAGVYCARFFRSIPYWVHMKVVIQTLGCIGIFVMIGVVVSSGAKFEGSHAYLGVIVLVFVGFQISLGIITLLGFSREKLYFKYKYISRFTHRVLGYSIFTLALTQIGLGINILYPWIEPRDITAWVIFFLLTGGWMLVFLLTWVFFNYKIILKDFGYSSVPSQAVLDEFERKRVACQDEKELAGISHISSLFSVSEKKDPAQTFTWKSLDDCIKQGQMLVVGNGKYVYDISKWIDSHPGGQIILHAVNGTDITNDIFHESEYDVDEFNEKGGKERKHIEHELLKRANHIQREAISMDGESGVPNLSPIDVTSLALNIDDEIDMGLNPSISSIDWKFIIRSRQTHVHSRLALERLSGLIVGEIQGNYSDMDKSTDTIFGDNEIIFDEYEYRRYALTSKKVESPHNSTRKVVRLRFCTLYPFSTRLDQPVEFQPGQCIEIQARLSTGERISRYYTPVAGDLNAFEILVRYKLEGKMSQYFENSIPGERQFKIRGPFGNNFLKFSTTHQESLDMCDYEKIYFFGGGSGITPALQILNCLYMSVNQRLKVVMSYSASLADELNVSIEDVVVVMNHYYDGWCYGRNITTGQYGSFPLACVCPLSLTKTTLISVHDLNVDGMGSQLIQGVQLAYPSLIQFEKYNSITLTSEKVKQVLDIDSIPSSSTGTSLVIVCGPTGMISRVVDILEEFGDVWTKNLCVLSSDSPNFIRGEGEVRMQK